MTPRTTPPNCSTNRRPPPIQPRPCACAPNRPASRACRARSSASVGLAASIGIGGALIYALQTRDHDKAAEELYSTDNRATADGLAGLPRDYTGPMLGPALPGDLGRPIVNAQNRGQPVTPPAMSTTPRVDPEEQRRLAEIEAARTSRVFFQSGPRSTSATPAGYDQSRPCRP